MPKQMNRKEYLASLDSIFKECLDVAKSKNHDYAKDSNPFSNFELSELLANVPTEDGIYIRLLDKVARIGRLLHNKNLVKGEGIDDALKDLINYSAILLTYLTMKKPLK